MPRPPIKFGDVIWVDREDGGIVIIGGVSKPYKTRQSACVAFFEMAEQKALREIENDIARARFLSAKSQAAYI